MTIVQQKPCPFCRLEEVIADLYQWRAKNGGTELSLLFGSIIWVLDYALERLAEHLGSTVEMVMCVSEQTQEMLLVSNVARDGFVIDIAGYSIWVERVRGEGWTGTTVVNPGEGEAVIEEVAQ